MSATSMPSPTLPLLLSALLLSLTLNGCALLHGPAAPGDELLTPENVALFDDADAWDDPELARQFRVYWLALYNGNLDLAWDMEAPFFRYLTTRAIYQGYKGRVSTNTPERIIVDRVKNVGPDLRQVHGRIVLLRPDQTTQEIGLRDDWVRAGGKWFHVVRDRMIFPFTN